MEGKEKISLLLGIGLALVFVGMFIVPEVAKAAIPPPEEVPEAERDWRYWLSYYCDLFRVPKDLAEAIVMVESNARPYVSRKEDTYSSYGLMQILYPTAQGLGYSGSPEGLFDVKTNIYYGVKYIAELMSKPHIGTDIEKIAAGYNAGPDLYPWPSAYIEKVKTELRRLA